MSRPCARADLGCTEVAPSYNRRAQELGWFFTRADHPDGEQAYCPAHNPPWVAAWRERRRVRTTHHAMPAAARFADEQCPWAMTADGTGEPARLLLREAIREHVRDKRHTVRMVTIHETLYEPAAEAEQAELAGADS